MPFPRTIFSVAKILFAESGPSMSAKWPFYDWAPASGLMTPSRWLAIPSCLSLSLTSDLFEVAFRTATDLWSFAAGWLTSCCPAD